jgi:DNA ligase-1
MIRFARLYEALDRTTSTNDKVAAMAAYFRDAPPADAAWAVFFLTGRRLKRLVQYPALQQWTLDATGFPVWMLEESYAIVGDGAEAMALLLDQVPPPVESPPPAVVEGTPSSFLEGTPSVTVEGTASAVDGTPASADGFVASAPHKGVPSTLAEWVEGRILTLRTLDPTEQQARATRWFRELDRWQRFILLKLLTGELRIGVSQTLVVRALAQATGHPTTAIAARLMGDWSPSAEWFQSLASADHAAADASRPYPFMLASPLEDDVATLGPLDTWQVEWKWDGIRAQLVRRADATHLWSRGEELITHRFPEIAAAATRLPNGTVLDGEVLAFQSDRPAPFSALQQRIGRQKQVAQMVRAVPVVFMAYDVLEIDGRDVRGEPLSWRRQMLDGLLQASRPSSLQVSDRSSGLQAEAGVLRTSPLVSASSWDELAALRAESRDRGVEGFMLKRLDSRYGVGRKRGEWWKWKIDPYSIDAVLIYAQPGSGKRASLLTDYTFGVWDGDALVPIAKAYSGLSNEEIAECDAWIRRHTRERFGPVRHVEPVQVFELGFEGIARSTRHRSGIAVRFPRMLRWRKDKPAREADTLETVRALLRDEPPANSSSTP